MVRLKRLAPFYNADGGVGSGNPTPDDNQPPTEGQPIPYERFKAVNDEKKALGEQLKAFSAFGSADDLAAKLSKLGELEKSTEDYEARLTDAEKRAADANSTLQRERVNLRFESLAERSNAVDTDDLRRFIDLNSFEVAEDGSIAGLAEAVDALKTSKPHLFKAKVPPSIGDENNPKPQEKTKQQLLEAARKKAEQTRNRKDIEAYAKLKRELQ